MKQSQIRAILLLVGAVTLLRFAAAALLPMTGDEAYYWEWARRLAAGYTDHPPMVAYAVALFAWCGRSTIVVRLAFVLCGLGATLAIARAAYVLWKDATAAALAALAVTLAPILVVLFTTVSPEGPAAFAWALALLAAFRAFDSGSRVWYALLGVAIALALLSHFLCWALLSGIVAYALMPANRRLWREGLALALVVAAVLYAPFVAWNAANGWSSFTFALLHRHPSEVQIVRPLTTYALCALAFSPGLWVAATIAAARPKQALLAWTALPLAIALLLLSIHERVETYWFAGPYLSLCIVLPGVLRTSIARWLTLAPAVVFTSLMFAAGIAPREFYAVAVEGGLHLRNAGPFEIFTYRDLARSARAIAADRNAVVMTDGYGFSSLMDYYANIPPVYIGYDNQGAEARRWYSDAEKPTVALFLDKAPLDTRPDFQKHLARACGLVEPGPTLETRYRIYYTTWCESMRPNAVAILRWER